MRQACKGSQPRGSRDGTVLAHVGEELRSVHTTGQELILHPGKALDDIVMRLSLPYFLSHRQIPSFDYTIC